MSNLILSCMFEYGINKRRISSLEMLDEIEELELVLQHYAVTWGVKLPHDGVKANWKDWGLKTRIEPNSHDEDD